MQAIGRTSELTTDNTELPVDERVDSFRQDESRVDNLHLFLPKPSTGDVPIEIFECTSGNLADNTPRLNCSSASPNDSSLFVLQRRTTSLLLEPMRPARSVRWPSAVKEDRPASL
jgi:hypothetical protein